MNPHPNTNPDVVREMVKQAIIQLAKALNAKDMATSRSHADQALAMTTALGAYLAQTRHNDSLISDIYRSPLRDALLFTATAVHGQSWNLDMLESAFREACETWLQSLVFPE